MKMVSMLLWCLVIMAPPLAEARCRTIGESVVEVGRQRDSVALQWVGYGIGVPLFVVAMPFAMVGAVAGAAAHPWTKCTAMEGRFEGPDAHLAGADR